MRIVRVVPGETVPNKLGGDAVQLILTTGSASTDPFDAFLGDIHRSITPRFAEAIARPRGRWPRQRVAASDA